MLWLGEVLRISEKVWNPQHPPTPHVSAARSVKPWLSLGKMQYFLPPGSLLDSFSFKTLSQNKPKIRCNWPGCHSRYRWCKIFTKKKKTCSADWTGDVSGYETNAYRSLGHQVTYFYGFSKSNPSVLSPHLVWIILGLDIWKWIQQAEPGFPGSLPALAQALALPLRREPGLSQRPDTGPADPPTHRLSPNSLPRRNEVRFRPWSRHLTSVNPPVKWN